MKNLKTIVAVLIILIFSNQKMYAQAGTLDPTFGNGGIVITNTISYHNKSLIQNDSKILIYSSPTLHRFNSDGTYDESFGINGMIEHDINNKFGGVYNSFALQNDGKIICTGEYYAKGDRNLAGIFRCNTNGSLDSSFGIYGLDTIGIDNINYITGIVV
ncbi:MAG: hypothetical protein WAU24_02920 [Chitinophagaceae bacterium]